MEFCSKCGVQVPVQAAFCGSCGTAVSASKKSEEQPITQVDQEYAQTIPKEDDTNLKIFVGKNYEYFKRKWDDIDSDFFSWNTAAFLFGFFWMFYKKMYLYTFIYLIVGIVLIISINAISTIRPDSPYPWFIYYMPGFFGNYLYKIHVEKKVKEITMTYTPQQAVIELVRKGNNSIVAAICFPLLIISTLIIILGNID